MRVGGYLVRASSRVTDPARVAREIVDALPSWRPGPSEGVLRERVAPTGRLIRWRPHRAALVFEATPAGPAHVKVYRARNLVETAIETCTPSRAFTSWRMGLALQAAGVPTPAPLLLLAKKPLRVHVESVLLTERLDDATVLLTELKARAERGEPVRPLLPRIARVAAQLHRAGFFHGDFTARNLVLHGPDRALSVIDLDRTKSLRWLPRPVRERIQLLDLRMLLLSTWAYVSRREWLRLLALYFRDAGIPESRRRVFARILLSAKRGRVRIGANRPTATRTPWPT